MVCQNCKDRAKSVKDGKCIARKLDLVHKLIKCYTTICRANTNERFCADWVMYSHSSSFLNIICYQTHICRQRGRSGKIPNLHKPRRFSGSRRSWEGQEVSVRLRLLSCFVLPLSFGLLKRYTGLFVHGPVITNRMEFSSRIICIKKSITQHRSTRSLPMRFWYHGFATRGHHHNTTKHYHFPEVAWPELSQQ